MAESCSIESAGLALGGGAARGWAHIGVILALADKNIRITHIAGTSIGAFVGAFYATNALDILLKNVMHLDWRHGVGYFASVPSKTGMINGRKITEFLKNHLNATTLAEDCSTNSGLFLCMYRSGILGINQGSWCDMPIV